MTPTVPAAITGLVATVLAVLGFNDAATQAAVKGVIAAGYALVIAAVTIVHIVQHYRTQRHADELAASVRAHELAAKAAPSTTSAAPAPAPRIYPNPAPTSTMTSATLPPSSSSAS